jgi:hypothetical protein
MFFRYQHGFKHSAIRETMYQQFLRRGRGIQLKILQGVLPCEKDNATGHDYYLFASGAFLLDHSTGAL